MPLLYGTENYQKQELQGRLWGYLMGIDKSETEVLKENDNYVIQKTQDFKDKVDYLEIWGAFNTGYYFMMRIPMGSIRDSVRTSNEFLGYFIVIGLAVSMILISWMSRKITTPLQELTELSKRMADLDFDAKYTSGGQNEIGQLGEHFNQMSETLERTISELKTANNQLQNDIEEKIQIDEMRKEFLSNVSHELKTPLTSISGYAELIETGMASEQDTVRFAHGIHNSANRLLTLINDIIRLSELDGTEEEADTELLNLHEMAQNCVEMLKMSAEKHKVTIALNGTECYVTANRQMMEELLYNLCDNAIRYNNPGGSVDVQTYAREGHTYLVVKDTGIGISKEHQERIFERFYRVDKSRSKSTGGTGLGLAIVKHIIAKSHAELELESEPGKGTTIRVIF